MSVRKICPRVPTSRIIGNSVSEVTSLCPMDETQRKFPEITVAGARFTDLSRDGRDGKIRIGEPAPS